MRRLKVSSRDAECVAFPLPYPRGDRHKPFDVDEYIDEKHQRSSAHEDTNVKNLKKTTWPAFSRRWF